MANAVKRHPLAFRDFSFREIRRVLNEINQDPRWEGLYQVDRSNDLISGFSIYPDKQKEFDKNIASYKFNRLIDYMEDLGLLVLLRKGPTPSGTKNLTTHRISAKGLHFLWLKFLPIQWCYLYSDTVKTMASAIGLMSIILTLIFF